MNGIKTEPGLIGVKTEPEVPLCTGVKSEPALPTLASKPEPKAEEHREDFQRKNNDNLSHNLPWPAVPGFGPHLLSQIERLVNRENMGRKSIMKVLKLKRLPESILKMMKNRQDPKKGILVQNYVF